jgi:hypothetical protein
MSDFRDPNDPLMRSTGYEPYSRGTGGGWGWIAAAVFLVIVLAIAFGVGREPSRVASNDATPPATRMSPLAPPGGGMTNPARPLNQGLAPPPAPAAPPAAGQ